MKAARANYVPLESGDRLSRQEFHRRYCLRPDITKAELINGVVYVASPVRYGFHGQQHGLAFIWLDTFAASVPGVQVAIDSTIFLGNEDEVQPDLALFRLGVEGATILLDDEGYLVGVPDVILEVAASSAAYDLHDKMEIYRRAGVQEYIVWSVLENRIDWWRPRDGQYAPLQPNAEGIIESEVFPGLRLAVTKMVALDRAGVLAALG